MKLEPGGKTITINISGPLRDYIDTDNRSETLREIIGNFMDVLDNFAYDTEKMNEILTVSMRIQDINKLKEYYGMDKLFFSRSEMVRMAVIWDYLGHMERLKDTKSILKRLNEIEYQGKIWKILPLVED
jgi:hypothetical protein